jgi:hypothetical protein
MKAGLSGNNDNSEAGDFITEYKRLIASLEKPKE